MKDMVKQFVVADASLTDEQLMAVFRSGFPRRKVVRHKKGKWFQVQKTNITSVRFWPVRQDGRLVLAYDSVISNWKGQVLFTFAGIKVLRWFLLERRWRTFMTEVEAFLQSSPALNGPQLASRRTDAVVRAVPAAARVATGSSQAMAVVRTVPVTTRCPKCSTTFPVAPSRPLQVRCPKCGNAGLLR